MTARSATNDRPREHFARLGRATETHSRQHSVLHTRVVSGTGGGPEKTILSSAEFLKAAHYRMTAAYVYPRGDVGFESIRDRAAQLRCPLIAIPECGSVDPRSLFALWKHCRRLRVSIWHGHDYKSNLFGILLRPLLPGVKLVTTVHGWVVHTNRTPLYYRVDKRCLPRYDRVLCVSDDLYGTCAALGIDSERLELVPNAIDEGKFVRQGDSTHASLRVSLGTRPDRLVLGAMGRLMPEKSFDLLIRAVDALVSKGHDIELWIAGEGSGREELERQIRAANMMDRVRLLGFVEETRAFYEALDLFVLSSQREGLPNVILEAAAMSLPIISTRVAGIPKMLQHGESALLCDIGDQAAMVESIEQLLQQPQVRNSLGRAARQLIEERYSFRVRMHRVAAIYDELLRE